MFISPWELYENQDVVMPRHPESMINGALNELNSIVRQPDFPAAMDELYGRDYSLWLPVRDIMNRLSSEAVHATYGSEALAWLAITSVFSDETNSRFADAERLAGYDKNLLTKSRAWCFTELSKTKFSRLTLNQYRVGSVVLHGGLDGIDLPRMLREAAQPGIEI